MRKNRLVPASRVRIEDESATTISRQRQSDPAKLKRILRGELDWVVMKALEKDRAKRYDTAMGLAIDLRRYLADEPVRARPPSRIYRMAQIYPSQQAGVGRRNMCHVRGARGRFRRDGGPLALGAGNGDASESAAAELDMLSTESRLQKAESDRLDAHVDAPWWRSRSDSARVSFPIFLAPCNF